MRTLASCATALACLLPPPIASADEIDTLLDRVRSERGRISTGEFHVVGSYKESTSQSEYFDNAGTPYVGGVTVSCLFDWPNGRFICDRTLPAKAYLHTPKFNAAARRGGLAEAPKSARVLYGSDGADDYHYLDLRSRLEIWPAGTVRPHSMPIAGGCLDIRALGLYNFDQLFLGIPYTEIIKREYFGQHAKVTTEDSGRICVTWIYRDVERKRVCFDPTKGYCPVAFESRFTASTSGEDAWRSPHSRREVKWKRVAGVWAPVEYLDLYAKYVAAPADATTKNATQAPYFQVRQHRWNITWDSMNTDIDESRFLMGGFNFPKGTKIYDQRVEPPTLFGVIGK